MPRIGLLSDTHSFLDDKVFTHFEDCDEIWHAGDIGTLELAEKLAAFKPLKAVWGNIDGKEIRAVYPEHQRFTMEGFDVWITHIGGTPGKYSPLVRKQIIEATPDIFICGHSHVLKIITDKEMGNMLYINPGAAGNHGFHKVKTLVKFDLLGKKIGNMKVIEIGKWG